MRGFPLLLGRRLAPEEGRFTGLPYSPALSGCRERRVRNGRSKRAVDVQASLAIRQDGDTGGGSA
ncbi:hypothetical protein DP806_16490 [Salmonella enterica subsp. enterica serovar Saintpaul]|nr:hypothetical protein [Salmonella enterica subsp. enterica serovar Saintpaul]